MSHDQNRTEETAKGVGEVVNWALKLKKLENRNLPNVLHVSIS